MRSPSRPRGCRSSRRRPAHSVTRQPARRYRQDIASVTAACLSCAARVVPQIVYVVHATCNIVTVRPHSGKSKLANGWPLLGLALVFRYMYLNRGTFFEVHDLERLENAVLIFCGNSHC